jgi:hypothetical protein
VVLPLVFGSIINKGKEEKKNGASFGKNCCRVKGNLRADGNGTRRAGARATGIKPTPFIWEREERKRKRKKKNVL